MNCRDCRFWSLEGAAAIKASLMKQEGYGLCLQVEDHNYLTCASVYCGKYEPTTQAEVARRRQLLGGAL
jgi:hypothetical protein